VISLDAKRRSGNYINVQFRRVDDEVTHSRWLERASVRCSNTLRGFSHKP
jgi:hypothetical protein